MDALVNNFVTERNSGDVMAVGLNAIREICKRSPLVMQRDLLQDLTQYKSYREKSVMMAARSLIHLFRDVNPNLLHKRDKVGCLFILYYLLGTLFCYIVLICTWDLFLQGKPTLSTMENPGSKGFGELKAKDFIPGVEALVQNSDEVKKIELRNNVYISWLLVSNLKNLSLIAPNYCFVILVAFISQYDSY